MDARELLRFITDRVDYDNPTGSDVLKPNLKRILAEPTLMSLQETHA
jgi:hypothetical protein